MDIICRCHCQWSAWCWASTGISFHLSLLTWKTAVGRVWIACSLKFLHNQTSVFQVSEIKTDNRIYLQKIHLFFLCWIKKKVNAHSSQDSRGSGYCHKVQWTHKHILLIVNFFRILCFGLPNTPFYSRKQGVHKFIWEPLIHQSLLFLPQRDVMWVYRPSPLLCSTYLSFGCWFVINRPLMTRSPTFAGDIKLHNFSHRELNLWKPATFTKWRIKKSFKSEFPLIR